MTNPVRMVRVAGWVAGMIVVASAVAFASGEGDKIVPIVDLLDNPIVLFGLGGGTIVTVALSILKFLRIVGKDGAIPTLAANFVLSLIVVTAAGMIAGQDFGTALVAGIAALVSAIGYHETVGHALERAVGKK